MKERERPIAQRSAFPFPFLFQWGCMCQLVDNRGVHGRAWTHLKLCQRVDNRVHRRAWTHQKSLRACREQGYATKGTKPT